jgi:mono/diheme cytochrome c family protein
VNRALKPGLVATLLLMVLASLTGCEPSNQALAAPSPASVTTEPTPAVVAVATAFYARPANIPAAPIEEPELAGSPLAADANVQRGQCLARLSGCIGCHTRPGGVPFAGGLALQTPFGVIVSTNITPDKTRGIGNYTLATFDAALRHGKDEEGGNLYPAMPYANYAAMTDDDIAALFAYFMQAVPAAQQDNARTALAWPFSIKCSVGVWNALYLPRPGFAADATQSAEWNRGAYLVRGAGHCGACHTPRGLLGAEKAPTEQSGDKFLAGALIDGWYAQSLRSTSSKDGTAAPGLSRWSAADIADYLRTGRNTHTAAFGAMTDVVAHSTQYLTPQDASAVAVYLKSLGGGVTAQADTRAATKAANASPSTTPPKPALDATTAALRAGAVTQRGAAVYLNNCSGCHRSDGEGAARTFPGLARSSTVAAADATSLIRVVLQGSAMPSTVLAPHALAMPGLGWRLSDDEVAAVLSLVRSSWGNQAGVVSAADVAKVRSAASLPASLPVPLPVSPQLTATK